MKTLLDKEHSRLVKKFHTLLGKARIDNEGKSEILAAYGVTSSKDLDIYQLLEICEKIDELANPAAHDLDKARKRLMAAIGGWLKAMHLNEYGANHIKAIACRAAQRETFNQIPLEQLRSLYSAFNKKQRDLKEVTEITTDTLINLGTLN